MEQRWINGGEREKKEENPWFTHRSAARGERNARGRSSPWPRRRRRRRLPRPRLHPDVLHPKRRDGALLECQRSLPTRKIPRCTPALVSPASGCSPAHRDDDYDDGGGAATPPRRPNCSRPPPRCPRAPNTWTCPRASCFSATGNRNGCCARILWGTRNRLSLLTWTHSPSTFAPRSPGFSSGGIDTPCQPRSRQVWSTSSRLGRFWGCHRWCTGSICGLGQWETRTGISICIHLDTVSAAEWCWTS